MTHSRILRPALLAAGLAATLCAAAPALAEYQGHYGNVPYVTGGVTSDEADALRAQARRYPLQVTMATPGEVQGYNDFVAGTSFQVRNAQGNVVLDAADIGPILLADLPRGDYTITANYQGSAKTRHVHVGRDRHVNVTFLWK
jgi:hypothetical protein